MSSGSPVNYNTGLPNVLNYIPCINFLFFVVLSTLFDVDLSEINETL